MFVRFRRLLLWGFAAVGVLGLLCVIYLAVTILQMRGRFAPEPAQIEAKTPGERFAVAATNTLPGETLIEIVIATEGSISRGGSSYSGGGPIDERNVVLLDKASGANRSLLTDNSRQIALRRYLPASVEAVEQQSGDYLVETADGKKAALPAAYYVLGVRSSDGKTQDLLLGDLKTGRQAFVLNGIDGIDRIWMQSPTRIAMLMRQGRKLFFRAYEMPDLKQVASQSIEIG